ncbi:HpcH/HpaI aldolase family protein [Bordetella bronchiseptica]|uniref:HpcH/HpaI aldolase family protein n=1 Tax=Bordetella bronchiseptica TaxID=518 RepID=UPI0004615CE8|nr:aldolase/citrate lyase family protein [Bordetella bronchiseptica]KDD16036.1 HpcH/HpaI aldolase/citrate lyase family protein [Bordetella bronchiseptica MBORD707]
MSTVPTPDAPAALDNPLMARLRGGGLGLSMIVKQVQSVDIAIAAHSAGYDAINIDLEHSVIPESAAAQICLMAQRMGVTPLVRVPTHDAHAINRILDAGAQGIVAPHVESAEQARQVARAARFAPAGERSVSSSWPQLGYRKYPAATARKLLDDATIVIVMLESPQAIEQADAIAAVPGVDILHVGTSDLCDALGIPGQFDHPRIAECVARVARACQRNGLVAGCGGLGNNPEVMESMLALGVRFLTGGNEWAFMMTEATRRARMLRALRLPADDGGRPAA